MQVHQVHLVPKILVIHSLLRWDGRFNSIATSIGRLPLENRNRPCVSLDLLLISAGRASLFSRPFNRLMILPIVPNDKCACWAISRIGVPSSYSLTASSSFSFLFNADCNIFYWRLALHSFYCVILAVIFLTFIVTDCYYLSFYSVLYGQLPAWQIDYMDYSLVLITKLLSENELELIGSIKRFTMILRNTIQLCWLSYSLGTWLCVSPSDLLNFLESSRRANTHNFRIDNCRQHLQPLALLECCSAQN